MSRQRHPILRVLMWMTVVASQLCTAQVCKTFDSASAEEAIRSLDGVKSTMPMAHMNFL